MNIILLVILLFLLLTLVSLVFLFYKRKKYKFIIITFPLLLLVAFAFTYIPHSVVNIDATSVSKITVFDGNSGNEIEITDEADIYHIISNLNEVTFQKGKLSFMHMGYSFRTTFYDDKGKSIRELTINSEDTIRHKGFFYTSVDNLIDYEYIEQLVR